MSVISTFDLMSWDSLSLSLSSTSLVHPWVNSSGLFFTPLLLSSVINRSHACNCFILYLQKNGLFFSLNFLFLIILDVSLFVVQWTTVLSLKCNTDIAPYITVWNKHCFVYCLSWRILLVESFSSYQLE